MKEKFNLKIDINNQLSDEAIPQKKIIKKWLRQSLEFINDDIGVQKRFLEVSYKIVSLNQMQNLNNKFRQKNIATNVLSFPSDFEEMILPKSMKRFHLGDVVICAEFVKHEAKKLNREQIFHWCHICVHGFLHLFGYDHIIDNDAEKMQFIERKICNNLDFTDPYQ